MAGTCASTNTNIIDNVASEVKDMSIHKRGAMETKGSCHYHREEAGWDWEISWDLCAFIEKRMIVIDFGLG